MSELISKATQTVQDAHNYLKVREGLTTDPEERVGIQDWHTRLRESAAKLMAFETPPTDLGPNPMYRMLSDQLDLTRQHILGLHERSQYDNVKFVLSTLESQLHTAAETGPGGWGDGPPDEVGPDGSGDGRP